MALKLIFLFSLLYCSTASAQPTMDYENAPLGVTDGVNTYYPWLLWFNNGTLSDSATGTTISFNPSSGPFGYWTRTGTTLSPTTASDNVLLTGTLGAGATTVTSLTDSGLTITRVPYASTSGLLVDNASLTTYAASSGTGNTVEIDINGLSTTTSIPAIFLSNTTLATVGTTRQMSPFILFSGHGWVNGADQQQQFAIGMSADTETTTAGYPILNIYSKLGAGSWVKVWGLQNNNGAATGHSYQFAVIKQSFDARETIVDAFVGTNDAAATNTYDQYSASQTFYGRGWKTGGTPASQAMAFTGVLAPEQGATNPIGVWKQFYGTNSTTATETNELYRLEWGDRLGIVFNEQSINGFNFRVESDSDANALTVGGAANGVGIGIAPASITAALHLKAGTATASTSPLKLTVGVPLTVAEGGSVNHAGTTTNSTFTFTPYINSTAVVNTMAGVITKTDTGDPANAYEGEMVINTFDNTVKIYADGGWRTIASGW